MSMLSSDIRNVWITAIIAVFVLIVALIAGLIYYNLEMGKAYVKAGYTIDTVKGSAQTFWVKPVSPLQTDQPQVSDNY